MELVLRKPAFEVSDQVDANQFAQLQRLAGTLKVCKKPVYKERKQRCLSGQHLFVRMQQRQVFLTHLSCHSKKKTKNCF